jgi:hypothetical protein
VYAGYTTCGFLPRKKPQHGFRAVCLFAGLCMLCIHKPATSCPGTTRPWQYPSSSIPFQFSHKSMEFTTKWRQIPSLLYRTYSRSCAILPCIEIGYPSLFLFFLPSCAAFAPARPRPCRSSPMPVSDFSEVFFYPPCAGKKNGLPRPLIGTRKTRHTRKTTIRKPHPTVPAAPRPPFPAIPRHSIFPGLTARENTPTSYPFPPYRPFQERRHP